ncbi:hypothetical protein PINS_up007034 [Pythium insidiosum]|nr:hypothetical protein PINS_up007034 [Pythium insidiosum]
MHARDELSRAMNKCFKRSTPWSESQVTVKFKNLRSEYIELKWLAEQPGFNADGHGMNDAWWADIKSRRPKVHAFKGKLPWPFYKKMAVIVGDLPASTIVTDSRNLQLISQLLSEMAADATMGSMLRVPLPAQVSAAAPVAGAAVSTAALSLPPASASLSASAPASSSSEVEATSDAAVENGALSRSTNDAVPTPTPTPSLSMGSLPPPGMAPIKAVTTGSSGVKRPREASAMRRPRRRLSEMTDSERERQQTLSRAVEQGSRAAADMARGFYELVTVFNQQVDKCMQLESESSNSSNGSNGSSSSSEGVGLVADERQILASLASSLAKSANATAEMAKGYSDLVAIFVQECEDATTAFTV